MMGSVSQSDELIHALHSIHAVMSHINLPWHSITKFSVVIGSCMHVQLTRAVHRQ